MTKSTERQRARLKARTRCHSGNQLRLRDIIVRPKTLKTYQISASRFLSFCSDNFGRWPQSYIDLDLCLCAFIEHDWAEGDPKSWALNTISVMAHFMPAVRGKTPGSSCLMNGWTKTLLPERAPPLPSLFATAVAGAALRRQDLRLCVLILIAFHALLRTGELCRVQASHFVRPGKAGPILLTLSNTISGIRRGDLAENVVLTDPVEHLWPKNSQSFRTQFRELCADARLPPLPWRPYSLRRGGATAHFLQFGSLDKTAVRGRWQSTRTARLYVDEGVAALASIVPHAGPRASHPIFGGKCGHWTDALSVNQNWQQVETAADWISCSLLGLRRPFRGVRRVMVVPCLRRPASRCRGSWRPPAFSTELSCKAHPREGIFRAGRQT